MLTKLETSLIALEEEAPGSLQPTSHWYFYGLELLCPPVTRKAVTEVRKDGEAPTEMAEEWDAS